MAAIRIMLSMERPKNIHIFLKKTFRDFFTISMKVTSSDGIEGACSVACASGGGAEGCAGDGWPSGCGAEGCAGDGSGGVGPDEPSKLNDCSSMVNNNNNLEIIAFLALN